MSDRTARLNSASLSALSGLNSSQLGIAQGYVMEELEKNPELESNLDQVVQQAAERAKSSA